MGATPDKNPSSRLDRLALWALSAALLGCVLIIATDLRDQFELPKQLWLRSISSLLAGLWLAARLRDPGAGWRRGPLDWPVLAWSAWLLVCTVHSIAPWVSWRGEYENFAGSATQLNYSLLYFAGVQLIRTREDVLALLRAILAAALGAAVYALMQALQRDLVAWSAASIVSDRFFGSLGNPNFLGGLMAMAIPLKLAMALDPKRDKEAPDPERWWRLAVLLGWIAAYLISGKAAQLALWAPRAGAQGGALFMLSAWLFSLAAAPLLRRAGKARAAFILGQGADLLLFFQALANTGTRGAFLGLMCGLGLLSLAWSLSQGGGLRRAGLRSLAVLGLGGLVLGGAFMGLGGSFRARVAQSLRDPREAMERSRLQIWLPALEIWRQHPIAGTGVDSFKTVFPRYSLSRFNRYDGENVSSRMAHCEPLQVASTQGTVGLLLWVWLCGAFFVAWWSRSKRSGDAWWLGLGALAAAYLGQNLVSFGVAGISVPFWLGLSLTAFDREERARLPWAAQPAGLALAAGLVLAAGGLWATSRTLRADLAYSYASQAEDQLTSIEQAAFGDLRGVAAYCLQDLSKAPSADADERAELDAWQQALSQGEQRLQAAPQSAEALTPLYRNAAASLLMLVAAREMDFAVGLCPHEVKYEVYHGLAFEELFRRAAPARRELWFKRAVLSYERSCELNPGNAYYRGNLGRLYGMGAEAGGEAFYAPAAQAYGEALDRAPVTKLFYENLLLLQARYAKLDEAGALLDRLEARDKELAPQILIAAASTFFQWKENKSPYWTPAKVAQAKAMAMQWGLRAQRLHPGDPEQTATLAIFAQALGKMDEARVWAAEALRLKPDDAALRSFLKQRGLAR